MMSTAALTASRSSADRAGHQHYRTTAGPPPPLRLTARGRIVVAGLSAIMVVLLFVALATAAQATQHTGRPGGPGRYVTRVVVQQGQSLWTLAQEYAPREDPRQVIQQVLQLNSLVSDQLRPGQVLWLPRD